MTLLSLVQRRETGLRGGAAITVAAAMIGALFAGSTVLTPLYVIYKQRYGFSEITLTLIYAVYVIGNVAALLFFGRLSDRIGRRPTALSAIGVAIVSALLFLFAQDVASLYFARVLSGLSIGVGAGTGTAWLAELIADDDKSRASMIATSTNFLGLGIGSLVAGLLAQFAPWPVRLPFVVYLAVLLIIGALVWRAQETVSRPAPSLKDASVRPRLSLPAEIRTQFVAPAVTGFGAMALVGFYAAMAPTILAQQLHQNSHAVAGALFFELAAVVSGSIVVLRRMSSRPAMLWALALMLPSVALVVTAQMLGSMAIMIAATAICGVAAGLGYRGSLRVVNQIAPEDRRAEVMSSYFVCCFCGNALPVIGIGVISTLYSSILASVLFAVMIVVFALVALWFGVRYTR